MAEDQRQWLVRLRPTQQRVERCRIDGAARLRNSPAGVVPSAWASSSRASSRGLSMPAARSRAGGLVQGLLDRGRG